MVFNNLLSDSLDHTVAAKASAFSKSIFHRGILTRLLIIDVLLVALHTILGVLLMKGAISALPEIFRIDRDWSLGEMFNYLKWIMLIGFCINLFRRQKAFIFVAIAITCAVALLDDSLQLHERFSQPLLRLFDPARTLPKGSGELMFMAMEGTLVAIPLIYGWLHASKNIRRQIIPLLGLFVASFVCAGAVDFLHAQATSYSVLAGILGILEDGGEMLFLSLMVSYMAAQLARTIRTGV